MYPPGPEYASGQSQMGMEASRSPARYPYMTYYGSKGPDPSAYGGMVGGGMPPGHPYGGGKPRGLSGQELMYGGNWNSMMQGPGYMGAPPMKVDMGGPYGMQVKLMGLLGCGVIKSSKEKQFFLSVSCVCAKQELSWMLTKLFGALLVSFGCVSNSFEDFNIYVRFGKGSNVVC